ncbi:hypothetical protein M885DRAFT_236194 [Pelagophyceae sp. CCMP2097]|nr:hypothetical protein M885DRAFT_236194 [Pelagophyceae sp. CCMP2097]
MAPPKGPGGKTTAPSKGDKKSKPSTGEADEFGGSGSARVSVRLACVAVAVAGLAAAASGGAAWPWAETEADAWIRASSRGEAAGDLCGVIAAPAAVRRELESLLDAPSRARGRVLLASGAGDDVVLVRAHGRVVLTRPRAVAAATADQALLAADYECAVQGSPRFFSDSSDRVRRLRAAVVRMDAHRPEAEPLPAATLAALRNDVEGVDLDLHGLWVEALLPSAALVATADTALLRAARRCDARGLRALLQLGADAAETYDSRDLRPLDVAVQCNARGVFAAAREVAVGCGAKCVNFGSRAPRDGLAPLHRALLRHASSFFAHRPEPNPWNMLAHIFMHEGANLTAPTLQTARETPLHICASPETRGRKGTAAA